LIYSNWAFRSGCFEPSEAGGEAKAIAIMKNGAALLLGGSRPEGRRKCSMLPKSLDPDVSNNNSLAHAQQPVSTHRPKLFFGQTFMFLETVASMPMQAARRMKRGSTEQDEHVASGVMARLHGTDCNSFRTISRNRVGLRSPRRACSMIFFATTSAREACVNSAG
jgi:hypothetical protein